MTALEWLLDSDPSIRWQTLRDLCDAPAEVVKTERARVAAEGWGARLLALAQPLEHGARPASAALVRPLTPRQALAAGGAIAPQPSAV